MARAECEECGSNQVYQRVVGVHYGRRHVRHISDDGEITLTEPEWQIERISRSFVPMDEEVREILASHVYVCDECSTEFDELPISD